MHKSKYPLTVFVMTSESDYYTHSGELHGVFLTPELAIEYAKRRHPNIVFETDEEENKTEGYKLYVAWHFTGNKDSYGHPIYDFWNISERYIHDQSDDLNKNRN